METQESARGQPPSEENVTRYLVAASAGDAASAEKLLPLIYSELRRLAELRLRRTPAGHTLQPTALVHEAYLRLVGSGDPGWNGRNHFFGAAAQAMRHILIDRARRKAAVKHGGDRERVDLSGADPSTDEATFDLIALSDALETLERQDPRKGQIVNLRYFAGLTVDETAAVLGVSATTVDQEWRFIRRWLYAKLADDKG